MKPIKANPEKINIVGNSKYPQHISRYPNIQNLVLHCPADNTILKLVEIRKAKDLDTGESLLFPKYACRTCKKLFTSLDKYPHLKEINYNYVKYINSHYCGTKSEKIAFIYLTRYSKRAFDERLFFTKSACIII